MARTGLLKLPASLLSAAVVAIVAMNAAAASTARAQATDEPPGKWPAFSDALNEANQPPVLPPEAWLPTQSVLTSTSVIAAPLPQALVAGLFMLGGNWVATRMWKKRKI